ncbi:MAG TPA: glycerol-3-phosphate acyltransferase [Acidimicrobiia bacterium]|jgi:glycerol-3-phosphate acyltransferase PlsY
MIRALAVAAGGYLWGAIPTADLLGRWRGVDLRSSGSRNPGANNAFRLGGPWLGGAVLVTEVAKGVIATSLGGAVAGDWGRLLGGLAALAGNVFNPFFRGRGGKGLGMTSGITLGAWPLFLPAALAIGAGAFLGFRRSGPATLVIAAAYVVGSTAFVLLGWPTGSPLATGPLLIGFATGIGALLAPRAVADLQPAP